MLRENGLDVDVFHFRGAKNPLNYLKAAIALRKKVKSSTYSIIHAQWGQSALPAIFLNLPLVVTFRGSDLFGISNPTGQYSWKGKVLQWASRLVAFRSDRIVVVTSKMINLLPLAKRKFVEVIPSGINLNLFIPMSKEVCRKKLTLPMNKKLVLFAGHPSREDKRYPLAVKVMEEVKKEIDVELFYADNVAVSEMPTYINAADVLLLTSKHEGSPNVIKESLACNVPVVSVDVGDVRERIEKIAGCVVCNSDNVSDIASGLLLALQKDQANFESRSYVMELDENLITKKYVEVYKSLL